MYPVADSTLRPGSVFPSETSASRMRSASSAGILVDTMNCLIGTGRDLRSTLPSLSVQPLTTAFDAVTPTCAKWYWR